MRETGKTILCTEDAATLQTSSRLSRCRNSLQFYRSCEGPYRRVVYRHGEKGRRQAVGGYSRDTEKRGGVKRQRLDRELVR